MATTGFSDSFGRTVAAGLGVATSGQTYTLNGTASQFSVAPNTASIAINATNTENYGHIPFQTTNVDITGQVALSSIPVTNLATAGFVAKWVDTLNYYNGTMMVAPSGAVSLRFTRIFTGGVTTLSTTVVPGITYVAGTFYNLRYQIYWSRPLQTNVMSLKLWAVGAAEPGGWMATITDGSLTDYTAGTRVGIFGRDESTTPGAVTTRYRSVVARSFNLPMPAVTDTMCADPAVAFPKQTTLQSLAAGADAAMTTMDPAASLAGLFPRVRVSNSNVVVGPASFTPLVFNNTEFNVGTNTNLGYNNGVIYLPVGIWMVTFEIQLVQAASNGIQSIMFGGGLLGNVNINMRSNAAQSNDNGVGGTGHGSALSYSLDPTTPVQCGVGFFPTNNAVAYTIKYMALSAIKVSDYFV